MSEIINSWPSCLYQLHLEWSNIPKRRIWIRTLAIILTKLQPSIGSGTRHCFLSYHHLLHLTRYPSSSTNTVSVLIDGHAYKFMSVNAVLPQRFLLSHFFSFLQISDMLSLESIYCNTEDRTIFLTSTTIKDN